MVTCVQLENTKQAAPRATLDTIESLCAMYVACYASRYEWYEYGFGMLIAC